MKSKFITTEEPKSFKPFTIEITAETIEDARLLWHLCNSNDWKNIIVDSAYWGADFNQYIAHILCDNETFDDIDHHIATQGYSVYKK